MCGPAADAAALGEAKTAEAQAEAKGAEALGEAKAVEARLASARRVWLARGEEGARRL